ncbi:MULTISPECIES: hypothetical protein [Kitasatospora]|nr:hypothetical protein [Kitasatospora sp. GP30]MDH6138999.1 hypothetical protein [Kitasatospora sp. GP30]
MTHRQPGARPLERASGAAPSREPGQFSPVLTPRGATKVHPEPLSPPVS